jgi:hypothetical protein
MLFCTETGGNAFWYVGKFLRGCKTSSFFNYMQDIATDSLGIHRLYFVPQARVLRISKSSGLCAITIKAI